MNHSQWNLIILADSLDAMCAIKRVILLRTVMIDEIGQSNKYVDIVQRIQNRQYIVCWTCGLKPHIARECMQKNEIGSLNGGRLNREAPSVWKSREGVN